MTARAFALARVEYLIQLLQGRKTKSKEKGYSKMKKGLTKEQRYYLWMLRMNKDTGRDIFAAYKTPSTRKVRAFQAIANDCIDRDGFGLCVLSATCQFFTAGYFYPDAETGELCARIELPTRTLDFAVVE